MTDLDCELLVVGGGAAGDAALGAYREHAGPGRTVLVSAEDVLPYQRPPLSKDYLRGEVGEPSLPLRDADCYDGVEVRLGTPVVELAARSRQATLSDGAVISYRHCVLAPGSEPMPLPVPGGDDPRVHLLRSLDSGRRLRAAAEQAGSAVVLGSGFIGCEAALSLARRGLKVTVVSREPLPQQSRLGTWVGAQIAGWLAEAGVELISGVQVRAVLDGHRVLVEGHAPLEAELVLTGGGARPRAALATGAGIAVEDGRVPVDSQLRTAAAGLYVAGDLAYAHNARAGRRLAVEHWGDALRMGEIAGTVAAGGQDSWAQVPGFWTGLADRTLKYTAWGDGFDDVRVIEHGGSSFTVWYGRHGATVGALTLDADSDYERAADLVGRRAPLPAG